jgi:hypothetical protein
MFSKDLVENQSLAPVRSQSAFARGIEKCLRNWIMLNNLGRCNFGAVRFQSALVRGVAENRCEHFPCCGHAIPTDCVSVELRGQLNIAVAKQSLYGFWIGSDADEKRGETVAQIVKTESAWIVIDETSSNIPVGRKKRPAKLMLLGDSQ